MPMAGAQPDAVKAQGGPLACAAQRTCDPADMSLVGVPARGQDLVEFTRMAGVLGAPSRIDSALGNLGSVGAIVGPNAATIGWVARAAEMLGKTPVVGPAARGAAAAPGAWSGFKKGGAGFAMWWWTKFITGMAAEQQTKAAQRARDELLRRGLQAP